MYNQFTYLNEVYLNERGFEMANLKLRINTYISKVIFKDTYNYNHNIVASQSILNKLIIKLYFSY